MRHVRFPCIVVLAVCVSGCGGTIDFSCDDAQLYETAQRGKRLEAPQGLDPLDELKEIPLPEASSPQARVPGSPCIDRPPSVSAGG